MLTQSQLDGAELVWLCELRLRGVVYRFADRGLLVSSDAGAHKYLGTLEPLEYQDEDGPWDNALAERSMAVSVLFGDDGFAAIVAGDHDLGDAVCELALHRVGDAYEDRSVILEGFVDEPDYASADEPVTFSVRESALLDRGQVPSPLAKVNLETWATGATYMHDPSITGESYPIPIGQPGQLLEGLTEQFGSPTLLVEISIADEDNSNDPAKVLIGDGDLSCTGKPILLQNKTNGQSAALEPRLEQDGRGRLVTVLEVANQAGGGVDTAAGDELWASFREPYSGGARAQDGSMLEGAGDILAWLLARTTLRVDTEQLRGSVELLNQYRFAFYVNGSHNTWDMAQDLLRYLPASFRLGPRGLQIVHWRLDATGADSVQTLNTGTEQGDLVGKAGRTSRADVANVLSINYGRDPSSSEHRLQLVFGPESWPEPSAAYQSHPLCSASFTRYQDALGRPLVQAPINTELVQDAGTAAAILHAEAMRRCGTHEQATFAGLAQRWQSAQPGQVIKVTHEPIGWAEKVCLVTSVLRAPGTSMVSVLSPNHWIRDALG